MILVFLLISLLIIMTLIVLILLLSNIKIEIIKLQISNVSKKFNISFASKISIFLFNIFKLLEINIDDNKVKKIYKSGKINISKLKSNNIKDLRVISKIEFNLEQLKVDGYIGCEDAAYTAYITSAINSLLGILISKKINFYNKDRYIYHINPTFTNQNLVNLELNCIISIKIVNIINIILILLKKGSVRENERTSNRRSYAYSNE